MVGGGDGGGAPATGYGATDEVAAGEAALPAALSGAEPGADGEPSCRAAEASGGAARAVRGDLPGLRLAPGAAQLAVAADRARGGQGEPRRATPDGGVEPEGSLAGRLDTGCGSTGSDPRGAGEPGPRAGAVAGAAGAG
eukprot:14483916-Alexandrium_andersonii.AAC.1